MPSSLASKILAMDTSSVRGSVALLEGQEVRAEIRLHTLQNHSVNLLSEIDFLLGKVGWTLQELNLVAVGTGPGSFTGIRIGVATAIGIAQSRSISFTGISGLDALAYQCAYLNGRIGILLDAHRSQVYYAEYMCRNGNMRRAKKTGLFYLSDLEHRLAERHLYIAGDIRLSKIREAKGAPSGWPRPVAVDLFLAGSIGRLAYSKRGKGCCSGDYVSCDPIYIRPPDALIEKTGGR